MSKLQRQFQVRTEPFQVHEGLAERRQIAIFGRAGTFRRAGS
jgi:hypothetical protein